MNPTTGRTVPGEVRDLLANLRVSDQQTNGRPELPPEQAQPARDWLCRILVDSRLLLAHLDLLQEFYGARFDSPLPRRFLGEGGLAVESLRQAGTERANGGEAPRGEGVTGFRHNGLLPEAEARAIAGRGPDMLADTELATLLLNPLALWDVADLINALLPEYWLGRMNEVGRQLMEEYGLKVAIPGLPSDSSEGGGVRRDQ